MSEKKKDMPINLSAIEDLINDVGSLEHKEKMAILKIYFKVLSDCLLHSDEDNFLMLNIKKIFEAMDAPSREFIKQNFMFEGLKELLTSPRIQ